MSSSTESLSRKFDDEMDKIDKRHLDTLIIIIIFLMLNFEFI